MSAWRGVASFACGLVFALGLGMAGMTRPEKIQGYLDVFGEWDPTLVFVMLGAVATFSLLHAVARRRPHPACDVRYHWPSRSSADTNTVAGAGLFGVGWALSGFCPGPAITSLATLQANVGVFVLGLIAGIVAFQALAARPAARSAAALEELAADAP